MSQSPLAAKSLSPGQGMVSGRPTVAGPQRKGFVPTGTCEPPRAKLLALAQGAQGEVGRPGLPMVGGSLHPHLAPQAKMSGSFVSSDHSPSGLWAPVPPDTQGSVCPWLLSGIQCPLWIRRRSGMDQLPEPRQPPALRSSPDLLSQNPV